MKLWTLLQFKCKKLSIKNSIIIVLPYKITVLSLPTALSLYSQCLSQHWPYQLVCILISFAGGSMATKLFFFFFVYKFFHIFVFLHLGKAEFNSLNVKLTSSLPFPKACPFGTCLLHTDEVWRTLITNLLLLFHHVAEVGGEPLQSPLSKQSLCKCVQFCAMLCQAWSNPSSPLYSSA